MNLGRHMVTLGQREIMPDMEEGEMEDRRKCQDG
jgi:hypothetical protein